MALFTSLGGKLPTKKHVSDAGFDLYANERVIVKPNSTGVVPTGVRINLPVATVGLIMAKSRSGYIVGAGVVDQGYEGELMVRIFSTNEYLNIAKDTPIAQLLIVPLFPVHYDALVANERGATGGILEVTHE
jgi:dUTP pyrophosphatase